MTIHPTSLKGQVALVTGGAVRVGRVICMALAERGAHVVFTHLPSESPDEAIAAIGRRALRAAMLPRRWRWQWMCVSRARPNGSSGEIIARHGRLDILVNNASVWLRAPFMEITREDWQTALDINLTGPFLMSQAVAPHMLRQQSGLIINITDLSAYQTWPGYAHHAASKAGLVALTRVTGRRACAARARQRDCARHGAVCPRGRTRPRSSGPSRTRC